MRQTTWQSVHMAFVRYRTQCPFSRACKALGNAFSSNFYLRSPLIHLYAQQSTAKSLTKPSRTLTSTINKKSQLMRQFEKLKSQYPNYIILFQVGEFYELYGEDASKVTSKIPLRLTNKNSTFMAGFPTKSLDEWQRILVEAGFQLAICDQASSTKANKKGKTCVLDRSVVKLVTPGTLIEPLTNQANYLLCLHPGPSDTVGLAWTELSTAELCVSSTQVCNMEEDIERIAPSEVLVPEGLQLTMEVGKSVYSSHCEEELLKCSALRDCHMTSVPHSWYSLANHPGNLNLESYLDPKAFSSLETGAVAALLRFIDDTQRGVVPFISHAQRYSRQHHMIIDANTRRALELVTPLHNNTPKSTLLGCVDATVTAAGGRLLKARLSSPLIDIQDINKRLDAVELLKNESFHCEVIVSKLKKCADLDRILQKIATGSASITDLQAVKATLTLGDEIMSYIKACLPESECSSLDLDSCVDLSVLIKELDSALCSAGHSDYILEGYSQKIDQLRNDIKSNEEQSAALVDSLTITHPSLPKLTIASHKIFYRVFEVTKSHASKADKCQDIFRVENTKSKARYSHIQLQKLNAEMLQLESSYSAAENKLFKKLCDKVLAQAVDIRSTALVLARLDVSTSLGTLARERDYCRPVLVEGPVFEVEGGSHPVVANVQLGSMCVTNDCNMSENKQWLITGPNMGGKSTFLRQNALISILAQTGCFVSAMSVTLGVVDRVFARVGASDNVVKNMSTFQMEMTETANILSNATANSFVILDEIGRGTSTSEGVALAQAVLEYLHSSIGCRSLVATHFHELSSLARSHDSIGCYKLVAHKTKEGIAFTYKVKPGYVEHSFATDVARLAGVPGKVVERAEELLAT